MTLAALALALVAAPGAGAREKPAAPPSGAGSWIVTYERSAGTVDSETTARERDRGFHARLRFRRAVRGFAARLTAAQVAALRADPEVASVTPDRPRHALGTPVAAGQTVPFGVRRVGAGTLTLARGAATSSVAVVDTGIDLDHPDLNVGSSTDCTGTGSADDDHGHGTHVAGTIGARNGAGGVVGVAPGTLVHAVKVLDAEGSGSDSSVICGLDWVTANATALDIRVANLSLGGLGAYSDCGDDTDALHEAFCRTVAAGVTVVVAAGNDGWDFGASPPDTPAWYPEALTVTAMGDGDGLPGGQVAPGCGGGQTDDFAASFSNFALLNADSSHTMAAPGVCVRSTYRGGAYAYMSGTSMAAPHVAGLVALCLGEDGAAGPCAGMTPAQIVAKLRSDAAQATTLGYGFGGDPASSVESRWYGHLGHAVTEGGAPVVPAQQPEAPPAPQPAPSLPPPPTVTPPPATPAPVAQPARTCRVHIHTRRHVHRRLHLHKRAGRVVKRHVHRRVHVHRTRHLHCG
jgi:subtilisin